MTNNDIIRRLRYTFDLSDDDMIKLFGLADYEATRSMISNWLKKEDDPQFEDIEDPELALFLNGIISLKRGKKEGPTPPPEDPLTNNMVLRKLKIALSLQSDDILDILESAELKISKHELSALFRHPSQAQYRPCKDQILRRFLKGLQFRFRPKF